MWPFEPVFGFRFALAERSTPSRFVASCLDAVDAYGDDYPRANVGASPQPVVERKRAADDEI